MHFAYLCSFVCVCVCVCVCVYMCVHVCMCVRARARACVCCLLYTSDAADDTKSVDLGGRRIIKKKFFQAEDGIRDSIRSRGLGDVYKRQVFFFGALL